MALGRHRRYWVAIWAVLGLALLLFAFAVYKAPYFVFSQFGPPVDWGSGVTEATPPSPPLPVPEWVSKDGVRDASASPSVQPDVSRLFEKTWDSDATEDRGTAVVLTRDHRDENDRQLIYFRSTRGEAWRQISVPANLDLHEVVLIREDQDDVMLASRWNPWYPYSENYARYQASRTDLELRCRYAIYRVDPTTGQMRFLFPGHELRPSPDRRRVAYLTSLNDAFPRYHTIWVYHTDDKQAVPVLSFWIAASASVWSVDYKWSHDSRTLRINGEADGYSRRTPRQTRKVCMVYVPETETLYEMER